MNKILYILILLFIFCGIASAQIGNPAGLPNPSSNGYMKYGYVREDSGFITMPRDTFCAKYPTIIKHNNGKYYRTEGNCTRWFELYWNTEDWSLLGNSGTTAGTNFIGTTDNVAWVIKTNNTERARFLGNGNFGIGTTTPTKKLEVVGSDALINSATTGRGTNSISTNIAFGGNALLSITSGDKNTGVGESALRLNQNGAVNTAFGYQSLYNNSSGNFNTAVGGDALVLNTIGNKNTTIGENSLRTNTTGSINTAIGVDALSFNEDGNDNTAIGVQALLMNENGSTNTAVGVNALMSNTSGNTNTAIGNSAGPTHLDGVFNTFIGPGAGRGIEHGDSGVYIGGTKIYAEHSKFVIINDGAANLAYQKDSVGNITTPVQTINNDTTNNKIVVQNTVTGRLRLMNWNQGSSALTDVYNEVVVSDGTTTVTLAHPYVSGTIRLYITGARIDPNQITEATATTITLGAAPVLGTRLILDYKY